MSTKTIIWIVVVILVVIGLWYWWDQSHNQPSATSAAQTSAAVEASSTSIGTTSGSGLLSSGNSNADLIADLSSIDTQTSSANSDSASVDQSFNDQPVQQSQP